MSLFSALRTSVSGMNAQSSYLSAIGDNIANSNTVGYKDASTQFETVLGEQTPGSYESGGVLARTRYEVTQKGTINSTTSATDLAINGQGFFLVNSGGTGGTLLTRAGSFVPDQNGNLVNTAGYFLLGNKIGPDGTPSSDLTPVNISSTKLQAVPTTTGTVSGNLPSTDASGANESTTAALFDQSGAEVKINVAFTKTDAGWDVSATTSDNPPMPLGTKSLTFDSSGQVSGTGNTLSFTLPQSNTGSTAIQSVTLDLSFMTSLASSASITHDITGSAPSQLASVIIGADGTLTGVYGSDAKANLYKIPIATVTSPDNLTAITGNVYQLSQTSGPMTVQTAGQGAAGSILSDNLEASTVDIATELTNMIVAQRSYEANSKVLQAASDLLSKLDQIQTG